MREDGADPRHHHRHVVVLEGLLHDRGADDPADRQAGGCDRQGHRPAPVEPARHDRHGGHQAAQGPAQSEHDVEEVEQPQLLGLPDEAEGGAGDDRADGHHDAEVVPGDQPCREQAAQPAHDEEAEVGARHLADGEAPLIGERVEVDGQRVEAEARRDAEDPERRRHDLPALEGLGGARRRVDRLRRPQVDHVGQPTGPALAPCKGTVTGAAASERWATSAVRASADSPIGAGCVTRMRRSQVRATLELSPSLGNRQRTGPGSPFWDSSGSPAAAAATRGSTR